MCFTGKVVQRLTAHLGPFFCYVRQVSARFLFVARKLRVVELDGAVQHCTMHIRHACVHYAAATRHRHILMH